MIFLAVENHFVNFKVHQPKNDAHPNLMKAEKNQITNKLHYF
jgi:hypothetical protein